MNSQTYKLSERLVSITALTSVPETLARRWMRDCDHWFETGAARPGSKGRMAAIPSPEHDLLAKRDEHRLSRKVLCALLGRPARSAKAFRMGLALAATAVRTSRPLALIERRVPGRKWESCLVMERIIARNLREYLLEDLPREVDTAAVKARLLKSVAGATARLHRAGFRQRDLKAANILVHRDEEGEFEVSMVDFDGMTRFAGPPRSRVRVRDLARLGVSFKAVEAENAVDVGAEDWEYLVAAYLEAYEEGPPEPGELAKVLKATRCWAARKIRRNRRRRRPVT